MELLLQSTVSNRQFYKTDTSLKRTLGACPKVFVLERVDCIMYHFVLCNHGYSNDRAHEREGVQHQVLQSRDGHMELRKLT